MVPDVCGRYQEAGFGAGGVAPNPQLLGERLLFRLALSSTADGSGKPSIKEYA